MIEQKRDKKTGRILFTRQMRETHTILIPSMAPIHFGLLRNILENAGYHVELLQNQGPNVVQEGLRYVHNDTCYPALLVIGQMIDALKSGHYDLDRTALLITQTGGGCRASNYIHLLRKALERAGYANIPVVSLNLAGLEKNSGFRFTVPLIRRALAAVVYGDMLMLLDNQTRPYEDEPGASHALVERWTRQLTDAFDRGKGLSARQVGATLKQIAADFAAVPVHRVPRVKVGIVGEIYAKYSSLANNDLEEFLHAQGCEVVVPGLMGFVFYCAYNPLEDHAQYGGNPLVPLVVRQLIAYLTKLEGLMIASLADFPQFAPPGAFRDTMKLVDGVISRTTKMGEGWLLTAEMIELVEQGCPNVICAQPFGCLPNHIVGKGMIRRIKEIDERANIVAIDYDPSATRVNQENRIKLMLAVAREQLQAELDAKEAAAHTDAPSPAREAVPV